MAEDRLQFGCDGVCDGFEPGEPRECVAIEELVGGQERVMQALAAFA